MENGANSVSNKFQDTCCYGFLGGRDNEKNIGLNGKYNSFCSSYIAGLFINLGG